MANGWHRDGNDEKPFYTWVPFTLRESAVGKTISLVLLVASIGFVIYLAATGVTLNDCGRWLERNLGINLRNPNMKSVPHPNYMPITPG